MVKTFVEIIAKHNIDGSVRFFFAKKGDGHDWIMDVRQAPSLKAGGLGIRYTCRIYGKQVYWFDEES